MHHFGAFTPARRGWQWKLISIEGANFSPGYCDDVCWADGERLANRLLINRIYTYIRLNSITYDY